MHDMPYHPLPSHGRLDKPEDRRPVPFSLTTGQPTQQQAQQKPDTIAQQVFRGVRGVNAKLAQHRQDSFDPRLTEQAQREKLAEFKTSDDAKAVDVFDVLADQLVAEKQAAYDAQFKSLTPVTDTAAELRAQRTWDREKAKLDALASEGERIAVARKTIDNCSDPATLAVLIEELPSYLETKSVDASWLPAVVAQKIPALGEAKTTLDKAVNCRTAIHQANRMLRGAIATGSPLVSLDKILPAIERLDPDA